MKTTDFNLLNNDFGQKYQLLAKIGSGGMGDVFLCVQRGAIDFSRLVVLKAIGSRQIQHSEEHAKMFANEARVVASLNHPHIVKIHDFFMSGDAGYIVMEYVEGETLKYIFSSCGHRSRRIPMALSFRLILDACDALHYAHNSTSPTGEKRQIIHRDIGLHNLMLDSNGYLKVIDFGIAKSNLQTDRTSPGLMKGNPAYMAPDLFTKESPDHRIDIYALGLCLYELCTQTRAFKFHKEATVGEIIQMISTKELVPPSKIVPDLPKGIDEIVLKAVEKERDNRYQTIEAFARDLKKVSRPYLTSELDAKEWVQEHFADRLRERREFGARMLTLAEESDGSVYEPTNFPGTMPAGLVSMNNPTRLVRRTRAVDEKMPAGLVSMNSLTPSTQSENLLSRVVLTPSNLYKLMGALFLLFVACVGVVYFLFFAKPATEPSSTATDNVIVSCNPAGSTLTVDGEPLGTLGDSPLALRVEPNEKHEIVLSKKGYEKYTLPFIGPVTGAKRIDATLIKIEPDLSFSAANKAEGDVDESAMMEYSDTPAKRRHSRLSNIRKKSARPSKKKRATDDVQSKKSKVKLVETEGSGAQLTEKVKKVPLIDEDRKTIPLVDD